MTANKKMCTKCGVDPNKTYQARGKDDLKNLKLVQVLESKGLHRSEQGDWESYHYAIYKCSKCRRYFRYTESADHEPVGISEYIALEEISKDDADKQITESMIFTEKDFKTNIKLSKLTTIKLGGIAKYFKSVDSEKEVIKALKFAKKNNLKVQVLGGGSNTIFADKGFDGLVLKVDVRFDDELRIEKNNIFVTVAAGKNWNDFVRTMSGVGHAGIEALAGIPGNVGATPIQNVGAYGQEVSETIHEVTAIDRETLELITFSNSDCKFSYRDSRFKNKDKDKYIITEVTFKLKMDGKPVIKYPQLAARIKEDIDLDKIEHSGTALLAVGKKVIEIRKEKSMVIDRDDMNTQSCGSFFTNPILSASKFADLKVKAGTEDVPNFEIGSKFKIPAAWLLEQSGFAKGYKKDESVGLSENHNLAIVNRNGTTKAVIALQEEIQAGVKEKFGVELAREPVLVNYA